MKKRAMLVAKSKNTIMMNPIAMHHGVSHNVLANSHMSHDDGQTPCGFYPAVRLGGSYQFW